jgi:uncharacterized membrane protein YedE/YeeE
MVPNIFLFQFFKKRLKKPILSHVFDLTKNIKVDARLLLGSALFGIGNVY